MSKTFKPMLAATHEMGSELTYPRLVSPKLDGIRCVVKDGQALSRTLKPIANKALREILSNPLLNGLDGELIAGSSTSGTAFNSTTRSVMKHEGSIDNVRFFVFDDFNDPELPFVNRYHLLYERVYELQQKGFPITVVSHTSVFTDNELAKLYDRFLKSGYEGAMLRHLEGTYKFGRSRIREGGLLKLKPWQDSEAIILGYDELEHNQNEAQTNELGRTKRSSSKEGKVAGNTLGALRVRDLVTGQEFSIGGGFTAAERDRLWDQKDNLAGKVVKYKSVTIGVVDAPRFPVYLGMRDISDIGEVI